MDGKTTQLVCRRFCNPVYKTDSLPLYDNLSLQTLCSSPGNVAIDFVKYDYNFVFIFRIKYFLGMKPQRRAVLRLVATKKLVLFGHHQSCLRGFRDAIQLAM